MYSFIYCKSLIALYGNPNGELTLSYHNFKLFSRIHDILLLEIYQKYFQMTNPRMPIVHVSIHRVRFFSLIVSYTTSFAVIFLIWLPYNLFFIEIHRSGIDNDFNGRSIQFLWVVHLCFVFIFVLHMYHFRIIFTASEIDVRWIRLFSQWGFFFQSQNSFWIHSSMLLDSMSLALCQNRKVTL